MKLIDLQRKSISMYVMLSFIILICFWANQVPATEKKAEKALTKGENNSSGFIEKESKSTITVKKTKKFPWLVVGALAVAGAVTIYLLTHKKKYTLTVTLGPGTTGTPATSKFKKGTVIPYSFTAKSGYGNLKVMLDGTEVAAFGNVTMDKDHALTTSATKGATIEVNSSPAGARIYLNKTDSGQVTPYTFTFDNTTTLNILLRLCGYHDWSKTVIATLGQEIVVSHTLQVGIREDFSIPASACWTPANVDNWSTGGGYYKYSGMAPAWDYSFYNHALGTNFTVIVKIQRKAGDPYYQNCIFLTTGNNMTAASGYIFEYTGDRAYAIWRASNWNPIMNTIDEGKWLKGWTDHSAIVGGLGGWNTLKIIKAASNYTFYINNVHIYSITNTTYNPLYIALLSAIGNIATKINYDYVYVSLGDTAGSIPGPAAPIVSATDHNQNTESPHLLRKR